MPNTTDDNENQKKPKGGATIIHVAFGDGGGRITPPPAPTKDAAEEKEPESAGRVEPVTDVFLPREVTRLLGLTSARLRYLDKAEIVSPSGYKGGKRAYTFQDLIALRATHGLLEREVKIRDVAKAIVALKESLPRVTRPLQELRIVSDGRRLIVRSHDGTFEPVSRQMVLDFDVGALEEDVVRVLRPETQSDRARTAYDLYMRASALDEDPSSFEEAEALYRRAIELDPHMAIAYTNLGNIKFRRGEEAGAEELYKKALEIDSRQPEAHYNLGYVMLERGHAQRAINFFEKAISADPRFADAHFNLAMAYEANGERKKAEKHWRTYLDIEPTGAWADIAREHLV